MIGDKFKLPEPFTVSRIMFVAFDSKGNVIMDDCRTNTQTGSHLEVCMSDAAASGMALEVIDRHDNIINRSYMSDEGRKKLRLWEDMWRRGELTPLEDEVSG